jgi:hypothetical protein
MKLSHKINEIWEFIRYDVPNFFKNVWGFRKFLTNYRWWDHTYVLEGLRETLKPMADGLETRGHEVDSSRLKKVAKIRRAIEILDNIVEDRYIDLAENELGEITNVKFEFIPIDGTDTYSLKTNETEEESIHNRNVYKRSNDIAEKEWNELFEILKGQDYDHSQQVLSVNENCDESDVDWDEWFDGSGIRGWWD